MVIEGEDIPARNVEKWDLLYDEFLQRGGGINYIHSLNVVKDIARLSSKITILTETIKLMKVTYSEILIRIVNDYGYKLEFKKEKEPYSRDIAFVEAKIAADDLKLTMKKQELEEMVSKNKDSKPMDREAYQDMIWEISIAFKMQFDLKKTFVNDLLILMKKFKQHIDSLTRNNKKNA